MDLTLVSTSPIPFPLGNTLTVPSAQPARFWYASSPVLPNSAWPSQTSHTARFAVDLGCVPCQRVAGEGLNAEASLARRLILNSAVIVASSTQSWRRRGPDDQALVSAKLGSCCCLCSRRSALRVDAAFAYVPLLLTSSAGQRHETCYGQTQHRPNLYVHVCFGAIFCHPFPS